LISVFSPAPPPIDPTVLAELERRGPEAVQGMAAHVHAFGTRRDATLPLWTDFPAAQLNPTADVVQAWLGWKVAQAERRDFVRWCVALAAAIGLGVLGISIGFLAWRSPAG
jgi:hypothetical protein